MKVFSYYKAYKYLSAQVCLFKRIFTVSLQWEQGHIGLRWVYAAPVHKVLVAKPKSYDKSITFNTKSSNSMNYVPMRPASSADHKSLKEKAINAFKNNKTNYFWSKQSQGGK